MSHRTLALVVGIGVLSSLACYGVNVDPSIIGKGTGKSFTFDDCDSFATVDVDAGDAGPHIQVTTCPASLAKTVSDADGGAEWQYEKSPFRVTDADAGTQTFDVATSDPLEAACLWYCHKRATSRLADDAVDLPAHSYLHACAFVPVDRPASKTAVHMYCEWQTIE